MKRSIHIHLPAKMVPALMRAKVTKDAGPIQPGDIVSVSGKSGEFRVAAAGELVVLKTIGGSDAGTAKHSQVTFIRKGETQRSMVPTGKVQVTKDTEEMTPAMSERRKKLIAALRKYGFGSTAATIEAKKYMSIPDMGKLERGLEAKGFTVDSRSRAQLLKEISEIEDMIDDAKVDRDTQEVRRLEEVLKELAAELKTTKDAWNQKTLVHSEVAGDRTVKIYKDYSNDEYQCELYVKGILQKNATYFTDDKQDALGTARAMVKG